LSEGSADQDSQQIELAKRIMSSGCSSAGALRKAQTDALALGKFMAQQKREANQELREIASDLGCKDLESFCKGCALQQHVAELSPIPRHGMVHAEVHTGAAGKGAFVAAATTSCPDAHGGSMTAAISGSWHQRHAMIRHADCEPIGNELQSERNKFKCWRAGVCICRGVGLQVAKFRNAVPRKMKILFPRGSAWRDRLMQGDIFAVFRPKLEGTPKGSDGPELQCVHISLMYKKPYRPTFQRMVVLKTTREGNYELRVSYG